MRTYKGRKMLIAVTATAAVTALLLSGCGAVQKESGSGTPSASPQVSPQTTPETSSEPSASPEPVNKQSVESAIYSVDEQSMELTERKDIIEYSDETELISKAMDALKADPEAGSVSLWKNVPVHSVKLAEGIVQIDISITDEARVGAEGESRMLESLQKTMFQYSFVEGIEIYIDGEKSDSMLGHMGLDYPMVRE